MLLQLVGPLLEVRGKNAEPNTVLTYVDDHHVEAHGADDDTDVARVLCSVVMYKIRTLEVMRIAFINLPSRQLLLQGQHNLPTCLPNIPYLPLR